uniref:malate dehydrogenase n=1 Tax=Zea mays TaxID=4577 RepID=A0A804QZU7_MAIZE
MDIVVEEGNADVGNTAEPSYEVVARSGCSAQLSTNDTNEHELDIESEDSKVSVGNATKQSHDVVGVGINCIFNHVKVSTEADLGTQPDVIHLTSLDVPNESSQISFDADMVEQNKQDALDTLIRISQHKKPKKLNVARVVSEDYKCTPEDVQLIEYIKTLPGKQVVVDIDSAWLNRNDMECLFHGDIQVSSEALSAYIHCIRDEEHLLHREGGKVFLENTFISSLLKRDGDPKHCSLSPLPAYEPAFDWENERSLIFGQRVPESIPAISNSGLKITVKVLSLSFQAGLVGQIGYAIVAMIARGLMLGPDQPVVLHMLDLPKSADALSGVRMELIDVVLSLLRGVVATSDEAEAFRGVSFAVLIGGWPRKEGMQRKDLIAKNVPIYQSQASALQQHAAPNYKGFRWYTRRLRIDEDGGVADEFLDEIIPEGSISNDKAQGNSNTIVALAGNKADLLDKGGILFLMPLQLL